MCNWVIDGLDFSDDVFEVIKLLFIDKLSQIVSKLSKFVSITLEFHWKPKFDDFALIFEKNGQDLNQTRHLFATALKR
jgi:hypothetical protein